MQRHFSNRGDALAEVVAGRMLAGRKQLSRSASIRQNGRRVTTEPWFSQAVAKTQRPERKQPRRKGDVNALL